MFKNILAPVQAWLLVKGQCVGCGMPLAKAKREDVKGQKELKVTCRCGRVYMFDSESKKYRRALIQEV